MAGNTHFLHDQGNGPFFRVGRRDGQWDPFPFITDFNDDKMTCFSLFCYAGSIYAELYDIFGEMPNRYNFIHSLLSLHPEFEGCRHKPTLAWNPLRFVAFCKNTPVYHPRVNYNGNRGIQTLNIECPF